MCPHVLTDAAQTKSEQKGFINFYKKSASNKLGKMMRGSTSTKPAWGKTALKKEAHEGVATTFVRLQHK